MRAPVAAVMGLVAALLTLEGGERLLRARQLGPPALREDEAGVWLMLPHMPGMTCLVQKNTPLTLMFIT